MNESAHSRHSCSDSTEREPLIDKTSDYERILTASPKNGKTTNETFAAILICGSITFIVVVYYIYSTFVVGSLRCAPDRGSLVMQSIYLSDLKNAEILKALDSNDPYVEVQFDGIRHDTSVTTECCVQ